MTERLTTEKRKIFARENITIMSMTKDELRQHYNEIFDRLQEYEVAEENGNVIVTPCTIGDKIYVIPSKANYKLNIANGYTENNRIYEQIVDAIHIYLTGYTLSCCEGLLPQPSALYGETWFLTKEEAEKALEELK